MPLSQTSSKKSKNQIMQEHLQENPKIQAFYEEETDEFHQKRIAKLTQANHNLVKKHWAEYGKYMENMGYVKKFAKYLCISVQGTCDDYICYNTLKSYMFTLLTCWPYYAGLPIFNKYCLQVLAYIDSKKFWEMIPLTTHLQFREQVKNQVILCKETYMDKEYNVSKDLALQYDTYWFLLQRISLAAEPITLYDMRKAQGNKADNALSSEIFFAYLSCFENLWKSLRISGKPGKPKLLGGVSRLSGPKVFFLMIRI
ncbi:hypothetical protein EV361DRAFT_867014 [Lentinula raphanica]|nr:hypothetical protein EV361DRAFT_867014 [Lentinula raphanica]